MLREQGFQDMRAVQGGLDAWIGAGLPVERKQKASRVRGAQTHLQTDTGPGATRLPKVLD
jgi:3-mercaptopyruvate sulfurtransferase SseA